MESDAKNYQIMDSWEEESRDKSTNISSALNIIEFILSTDPQEDLSENDTINTRTQQLSATICQPEIKPTETSKKDSGSTDKNRQSGSSHEYTTEAKDRNIDQETVQRGPGRRGSSDSRAEAVVSGGISRSITDSKNGTQNTENIDLNEIGKMDKDSIEGKMRQSADVPSEISGSDGILTTEQSRNSDHGRSLESISTPDTRSISVVTAATPDDEEEILMRNSRMKKSSVTHQEDDKRIKKGGKGKDWFKKSKDTDNQISTSDLRTTSKGQKKISKTTTTNTDTKGQTEIQAEPSETQPPSWNLTIDNNTDRAEQTSTTPPTATPRSTSTKESIRTNSESKPKTQKTNGKERKDTEESNRFTERAITLLQNLGVIQSTSKLDLYQDKRVVCVANVLNNVDTASKIDFLAGLVIGVSMDNDTKLIQIQNEMLNLKADLKKMDESHRRLIENQREQLSLITSLISNLKIMTERGGKKDQNESNERVSMIKTKLKEEKIKKTRFDPLMEAQGIDKNIPDLYRHAGNTLENDLQVKSEILSSYNESNATRLIPKKVSSTMRSLVAVINNSNLSQSTKQSYINELKHCKSDEEVSELMDMFNEDVNNC
uniref:Phosphoprotein n=1 Tax=Human respirovirus 3 TaxID=11216 RepID=A0A1C9FM56_9MONO|nr:phosphoprotein [Human respirovirus 3]APT69819.1 phosphoprotein [Human respirovirus 3]ARF19674.1 phosphoprotein [Human respirovirus 3]ARQ32707.1 phosphoprotein [Human respirovirus 3]ARQ32723.1 phosphoprotein [Human respirovirus 3]